MKLWFPIILEWLNCLDILERNIKDLKELEDEKFYRKLIELFSWKGLKEISSTENIVKKFLQDEYPEFKLYDEPFGQIEHIYIASLFLLHTCQEPLFHQPMCNKLQHETQIKIKMYLEMIIPYGRNISRETLKRIIIELEDDIPKTPVTPQRQSLKDFFYSPITQSAKNYKLLNEKNHELRKLRTKLELEQFEKADLQEDLRIQQNEIQNLQKKLQQKTADIKALREERMESNTPLKKNESNKDYERHYKKEIDYLENQLLQKQCDIDKFEMDNDIFLKKIACLEKQCIYFKEKSENFEKSFENLQVQAEIKDRELINLRLTNEELRTHLKELTETGVEEQSFEIDDVAPLNSTLSSFNNSEVLSSVIEIQLQEAKEESALLKAQLDDLKKKLDLTNQERENVTQVLQEKIKILQDTETELNTALNKLNKEMESLQQEKISLIKQNKNLEDSYISQKELLLQLEESKNILNTEVITSRKTIENIEKSLHNENENNMKLNTTLTEIKLQLQENMKHVQDLTQQTNLYKTSIESNNANLKKIILHNSEFINIENVNLDDSTTVQLIEDLQKILCNLDKQNLSKQMELKSLNDKIEEMKLKEKHYQSQIFELDEKCSQNSIEISKLKETIALDATKVNELTNTIHQYSEEILDLKQIQIQKQTLEKDLHLLKEEACEKDSLLHSTKVCIQILKENLYAFATEFRLTRKDILNQLNEYQRQDGETVKTILNASEKIYNSCTEEQFCRRKTEEKLADYKKELKDYQSLNTTLENNLTKSKLIINDLEKELMSTKERLMESVQKLTELKETKEILEKHHKTLKSQHEKILFDLNNINDKLKFSQLETCNMSSQLKSKDEKIENLIAEITSLKEEKRHIISLQTKEESKMKSFIKDLETKLLEKQRCLDQLNIEAKLKQETLELNEMKMKEIVMNFQKVETNQNAVLITQEKILKEKDLQIEQLQKEFNESKNAFHKHLEDEKLLNQLKLDEIKQSMKTTYNEQIIKLNREQEQCIQTKLESFQKRMELQYRKQAEELNKYKAHVTDMSSQIWNVGEKLLSERQEKEKLHKELIQLKEKYQNLDQQTISSIEHKTFKYERRDLLSEENKEVLHKVTVPKEKTTDEKRCSIRNIQTMGNVFHAEDEEGEVFDNVYLADMKNGHSSFNIDTDRVSILQKRNALCKPHLKSSYPAEMQFHPLPFTEDEIKSGSTPDEIFNDSLSQSLLPEQKTKKRDRTQTSYKKPGPPTPSKNGGRLSLQGNELRSPNSRILRDRNKDRATATPRTLRCLFNLKRQDENVIVTPKAHRRSRLFRKYRINDR